jgi:hypothetical protein
MYMAMTFVRRSDIPVPVKGKVATSPQVTINENGQMVFSTLAVRVLGGKACTKVGVFYDKEKRTIGVFPKGHKAIVKQPDETLWDLKHSSKGNSAGLSGSGSFLNDIEHKVFADDGEKYNYKESGGQTFPVTERDGYISFVLPKGKLTPKPKMARAKKAEKKEKVQPITANAPAGAPEELTLETA